ncbi:MAG: hypothetical protein HRT74_11440 [Flavobacteriales bacterium]|nr:hypothetical protein [Flavobacteriales bacterium]
MQSTTITPLIHQLRLDHIAYFSDAELIHLSCLANMGDDHMEHMILRTNFDVFNNLLMKHPSPSVRFKLSAELGEMLSQKHTRWEYLNIRKCLGESLVLHKIRLVQTPVIKKNGDLKLFTLGHISKKVS